MRYIKVFLVLILLTLVLGGCTQFKLKDEADIPDENGLIEKVKTLEKNYLAVQTGNIDVSEYKENIKGIFNKAIEEIHFNQIEEDLDEDRLTDYADYYENNGYKLGRIDSTILYILCKNSIDVQVSVAENITEGTFDGEKRVHLKIEEKFYYEEELIIDQIIFRMFNFKNIDGQWRITEVRDKTETLTGLSETERNEVISKMPFNLAKDGKVSYVKIMSTK